MSRRASLTIVIAGNLLLAASALFSFGAYTSHDASGLQYIALGPAAVLAGLATLFAIAPLHDLRYSGLAWCNFLLPVAALWTSQLTNQFGYTRAADSFGAILAGAILVLTAAVGFLVARRVRGRASRAVGSGTA